MNYHPPIQSIFWPRENTLIKQSILILFGVLILAIASQFSIPLNPVPITFQSTTVVLIGMLLGARHASYVMIAYLLAGIGGLPVFAEFSAGPSVLFGPTFGYLLGFLPAAFLCGLLAQKGWGKTVLSSFVATCLGTSIIFLFGVAGLALFTGWERAVAFGLMPFILSEPIKLIVVSYLIPKCWKQQFHAN